MKKFNEKRETTDSRIYRMSAIFPVLGCTICGPNQGCNKNGKQSLFTPQSWKKQKKRKQWM